jgi:putative transposase
MPWSQTTPMHQRTLFVADHLRGSHSVTELCADYGISRKTGYKWIERFMRRGAEGLEDRSRRPRLAPNATDPEVRNAILELRRRHPTWGAKKLLVVLGRRHPSWKLPCRSVTCELLKRHGLVSRMRTRRVIGHPGKPTSLILAPNQIWCAGLQRPVPHG